MASQSICNVGITGAGTFVFGTTTSGFGKPLALSLVARFTYVASSATSVKAYVQTSLDGTNWMDIACFAFTTASGVRNSNIDLLAQVAAATPTDGTLADNTCVHGLLGDQVRVKYVVTGTYGAGTNLTIHMQPRG